jgi:uncharacterized protein (TIGR02246 family)
MGKTIEERLQVLEDERTLRELLSRYAFNADLGRAKEYAGLFTEDGVLDLSGMGGPRFEGRTSILEDFITQPMATATAGRTVHAAHPTVIHIEGDDATAEGIVTVILAAEDGSLSVAQATLNHWTFRREEGEWRIVERDLRMLGTPEAPDMLRKTVS